MPNGAEAADRMTAKYKTLISRFCNHQISAEESQKSYFAVFKSDQDQVASAELRY
jgi:Bacterial self-protective colicin-like immunity